MKRIVVDPVNRIEGHLRLEINVDEASGKVTEALSSGTAWRGIELIVKDRDPRDAWLYTQRICGVCTTVHALACLRAVEDALKIEIPKNAGYIRNIIAATQCLQDHVIHFYHLHALDWISPVAALKADPAATASLQETVLREYTLDLKKESTLELDAYPKEFPQGSPSYFKAIQAKVAQIVESGQLGIFAAHYWEHPDYDVLPPEVHLMAVAHYLNMLDKQRELVTSHVVFGGKNPHPHYIVGGMPCSISMQDMNASINTERLAVVANSLGVCEACADFYYLPDAIAIGAIYAQKGLLDGGGLAGKRVLGFGDYPETTYSGISNGDFHKNLLLRCDGVVENFAAGTEAAVYHPLSADDLGNPEVLTEGVEHAWYEGKEHHPWEGETKPKYTAPKVGSRTHWKELDEAGKYSWIKTPAWRGKTAEVGPLARYIIVYTKVKKGIIKPNWLETMMVEQIEAVSRRFKLSPERWMLSTVGRTVVRAMESQIMARLAQYYFEKLVKNIDAGDTAVAVTDKWEPASWPKVAKGVGLHEAPRGALSHWTVIKDGKIANYQAVVPSTWNACPRDDKAGRGAYEEAMLDTKVKIAEKPLEILRAIHSFDPCLACATHIFDKQGKEIAIVQTDPYLRF